MSRLVVKGFPETYSKQQLSREFSAAGFDITDCKLLRKSSGVSRRIAFVGFATEALATEAIDKLNNVWLAGGKLSVEKAKEAEKEQFDRPLKKRKLDMATVVDTSAHDVEDDGVAQNEELTDAEYLARRRKRVLTENNAPTEVSATAEATTVTQEPFSNGRLFLRNLPFSLTSDNLQQAFSKYGTITEVKLPQSATGQGTGIGYIAYSTSKEAQAAHADLDGKALMGRLIHILPAIDRKPSMKEQAAKSKNMADLLDGKLKKDFDKSLARHDQGRGGDSTLNLNSDAVVSTLANMLNLSKSEILDPTSSSSAVKLAQAETSILNTSINYFLSHGADLKALSTSTKTTEKHPTTLILSNLPPNTIAPTMKSLIEQFGTIKKLLIPSSGTIAVVEMLEAKEASSVLKNLSYQKLGNSVIYVKRVPMNFWVTPVKSSSAFLGDAPDAGVQEEEGDSIPTNTLFVQNISFSVTADQFARAFKSQAGFAFAKLVPPATTPTPTTKEIRSKGYGFVGFNSVEFAKIAQSTKQGHLLDGRPLSISFAKKHGEAADEESEKMDLDLTERKKASSKMLVKNVPFEASLKDLKELFSSYGSVKSLRLPKRADKRSRGFAFVEFANKKECEYAMKVLKDTHLLGRHLVFEFVKESQSLDDMMKE